jgi:hypothetical protein
VLIVLSSMRVAIGPVMAGAGVAGIAVWLGAQLTIADVGRSVLPASEGLPKQSPSFEVILAE